MIWREACACLPSDFNGGINQNVRGLNAKI